MSPWSGFILIEQHKTPARIFDQFLTRVQRLSKKCEFGELCDSLIKDRLVIGINDDNTRERLLRTDDLDLEKAVQLCKAAELVKQRSMELKSESVSVDAVHKSDRGKFRASHQSRDQLTRQSASTRVTGTRQQQSRMYMTQTETHHCQRCGTWHQSGNCRAYGKRCGKCGVLGHFAKFCRSASVNIVEQEPVPVNERQGHDSDTDFLLNTVTVDSVEHNGDDWIHPLLVNNVMIPVKLDTGAQTNILSEVDYKSLRNRPKLHPTQQRLKSFYNGNIPAIGKCVATVLHRGESHRLSFFVVPGGVHSLLGRAACERLNLIGLVRVVDIQSPQTEVYVSGIDDNDTAGMYEELKESYCDVFEGLGCLPGQHTIVVDKDVTPVVHACRKIPFALRDKVKAELDRMEQLGVICKVDEPTEWVSSLVVVTKKNGSLRLCLDPRDLNKAVKRQHYKLPTREEIMSQFAGATVFSKLDASQGFWQLELDEPSSYLCTFNTPFGRYRYRRLPFGISSAPEVYHKTIHDIVANISNVDTIADDIIVWGRTNQEHDASLRAVLDAACQHNLRLNKDKCEFGVKQLTFIGDVISAEGVKPDVNKVSAIYNMPKPANKDEVRRLLGMVTYLAK